MNNRILKQFHAIFGLFMVVFYLGIGIFLIFYADRFMIDKALRTIIGAAFIIYGVFRIFTTINQIRTAFSTEQEENE